MDWSSFYTMQQQLDDYIEHNHELSDEDLFRKKYLALLVEIGELANETRCFKFWSNKPRNKQSAVLEEYVDGIHFILSLGLEKGFRYNTKDITSVEVDETEQFTVVFSECMSFYQEPTEERYERLFTSYLQLGELLGFDEEAIMDAYFKKNEVNYERQDQDY